MIWSNVQSGGPGSYDWQPYDELIAGLVARGIQPLVVIDTTPSSARPADCSEQPTCAPADPRQYAQFAAAAVTRYHAEVRRWEDSERAQQRGLLEARARGRRLYGAVEAHICGDQGRRPRCGGDHRGYRTEKTTRAASGETVSISPVDFLAGIYRDGGEGSFDAVGAHPYTFPEMPGNANPGDAWAQLDATATSMRSLMVAHGDGSKLIWGTEFGAHTDPTGQGYVDEAEQAAILTRGYQLWSSYSWTGPLIWFSYQDTGIDPALRDDFFGLTQADGAPKPAYFAFKALAGAG